MGKPAKLKWEYCECGCKCSVANAGPLHYSLFNTLKGPFFLSIGQHGTLYGKKYKSREEAVKVAEEHAAKQLKEMQEALHG